MIGHTKNPRSGCAPNERDLTVRFDAHRVGARKLELTIELTNETHASERVILDFLVPRGYHLCPSSWTGPHPIHPTPWDNDSVGVDVGSGESVAYRAICTPCEGCASDDGALDGFVLAIHDPVEGPALLMLTHAIPSSN